MARRRVAPKHDDSAEILRYYRELLAEPDDRPDYRYPPMHLGPTWEKDSRGRSSAP